MIHNNVTYKIDANNKLSNNNVKLVSDFKTDLDICLANINKQLPIYSYLNPYKNLFTHKYGTSKDEKRTFLATLSTSITVYKFIDNTSLYYYMIIYDILGDKTYDKNLVISPNFMFTEPLLMRNTLLNKQYLQTSLHHITPTQFNSNITFHESQAEQLKRNYTFQLYKVTKDLTYENILELKATMQHKYDFIIINTRTYMTGSQLTQPKDQRALYYATLAMHSLKNTGDMLLFVSNIHDNILKQLIYLLQLVFVNVTINIVDIIISYNEIEIYIYCSKFKENSFLDLNTQNVLREIINKWYNVNPKGGIELNIKDEKIRNECGVIVPFDPLIYSNVYVTNIFETNKQFDASWLHINKNILELKTLRNNYIFNSNLANDMSLEQFKLAYTKSMQDTLPANIQLVKKYGLEISPEYENSAKQVADVYLNEAIDTDLKHLDYTFETSKLDLPIISTNVAPYVFDELHKLKSQLLLYRLAGDTRDFKKYQEVSVITLLNKEIVYYIKRNLGYRNASRAFVKMYELLDVYDLIDKNADSLSSFHTCEAPGNFIKATEHFCFTKLNIKKYDWNSNSLNPEYAKFKRLSSRTGQVKLDIIGDDYGYIKNNPTKWLWGVDNTGDITKVDNIVNIVANAKKNLGSIKLFTSDCGFEAGYRIKEHEVDDMILSLCQVTIGLSVLDAGGSAVFKVFLPLVESLTVNIGYLLYILFEQFSINKQASGPPSSSEVYFVCKKLHKPIDDKLKQYLLHAIKYYDRQNPRPLFPKESIDKTFLLQWEKAIDEFIKLLIHHITRTFFYLDNNDILKEHMPKIKANVELRAKKWVEKYNFKKNINN